MAAFVLFFWLLIPPIFFRFLGPPSGLIWSTLVGYLFLPEDFDINLPGLPPYNKETALALSLILAAAFFWRHISNAQSRGNRAAMYLTILCIVVYFVSILGTYMTNRAPVIVAESFRPGLTFNDVISMISGSVFLLVPAFFAWLFLREPTAHQKILEAIVAIGLFYSLLVLFEWRMSPQLHNWVYGYFPHSWIQHLRGDGFRPVVFLNHGLWVGIFLYMVVISATVMAWQTTGRGRAIYTLAAIWMLIVLFMSYNLGATILAVIFLSVVLMLTRRIQTLVVLVVALTILVYPAVRGAMDPALNAAANQIERFAPERAASFQFRLDNEAALLERAAEKRFFGWGGWSRARVFDEFGRDTSVTDGLWIIVLGERGWIGYLSFFGFVTLPLFFLGWVLKRRELAPATIGVAIILSGNLVYIIPNAALNPISWVMVGALAGFVTRGVPLKADDHSIDLKTSNLRDASPRLTRFPIQRSTTGIISRPHHTPRYRRNTSPEDT